MNTNQLIIADVTIHHDSENRYCLNDLHKAAGNESKNQPSNWLRLDQTKALIEVIDRFSEVRSDHSSEVRTALKVVNGGINPGTFAVKPLVYAYAMWISPEFNLHVINAYDALVTGQIPSFLLPVTRPMLIPEAEQYGKQLYGYVDELIKNIPVIVPLGDYQKQKKTQVTIPGMDETPDLSSLSLAQRFENLLAKHLAKLTAKGSTDNAIRSQRCTYRRKFAETGEIPSMLLGKLITGRKTKLLPEVQQRFIELVKTSADENHANYLPLNERKVTHFQFILEDEFKQEVNINQLRTFAKSHGLKCYLMTRVGA